MDLFLKSNNPTPTGGEKHTVLGAPGIPGAYAHIEIVVAFLVVNFFVFLVITRDHGSFEGRH